LSQTVSRTLRFLSLLLAPAAVSQSQSYQDLLKADPANWLSYSGTYSAQRHSLLKQIHSGNVQSVVAKWIYHVPHSEELEGVPVVADGVMYVPAPNEVEALDARTGRLIWQYQRNLAGRGHNRGLAVYEHKVYLGTTDAFLVALDSRTGAVVWETKMPGQS